MIAQSVTQLMGGTPLLELSRICRKDGLEVRLLAKPEGLNPAGSAKDRVALNMILTAEEKGLLTPGATIIEPTSGYFGNGYCISDEFGVRPFCIFKSSIFESFEA